MFQKDNKIISVAEAVKQVTEAEKVQTPTGMKVYGSSYGNSQKARADQTKKDIDKLKGPKEKEMKEELKGNQDKIDANHNNKIDSQDFKILRGKKKIKENTFADRLINHAVFAEEVEEEINEVLSKDAKAGDWIHDFVHSDNPKFKGKSKAERKKMALGAYYAKQNEEKETHDDKGEEAEDKALIKKMVKKDALKEEELDEAHYQMDDSAVTTDTLAGRVAGGKTNSFKSFKLRVKPLDKEGNGEVKDIPCDTPEKTTARASIHAEETVEESFADEHGIGRDVADKKQKMDRLKTPAKPGPLHNVAKGFKAFLKGKPEPMESTNIDGEVIEEKKDLSPGQDDAPFEPPYTTGKPDNVKDKSGAVHTPMSRARDLARSALKKVKTDLDGGKK